MVQKRLEDSEAKLRELGALGDAEVKQFSALKRKALLAKLGDVNEALQGMPSVNKAALEQLNSYRGQKEELVKRAVELDASQDAIVQLIETLDARKDEAIVRTFKGVMKSFAEVFTEMVPRGSASMKLEMTEEGGGGGRAGGGGGGEEEEEEEEEGGGGGKKKGKGRRSGAGRAVAAIEKASRDVERYKGVSMHVSFTAGKEGSSLAGLSGGQATLVALALIFAIQRADPAPFYVFDEIDSALDATHRDAVGKLIKSQSRGEGGAQFITSTFHPEILAHGDAFFGVVLQRKTSNIEAMDKPKAVGFVKTILAEEAAKGGAGGPLGAAAPAADTSAKRLRAAAAGDA
jgi:structural maintenance of chromosome 3 (chondroitin sulfate proteoglycan 6)